jgi:hypothetical protein
MRSMGEGCEGIRDQPAAKTMKSSPKMSQMKSSRLNQALGPLGLREKHIGHKECPDCEEDQPESSQERSSRQAISHFLACGVGSRGF